MLVFLYLRTATTASRSLFTITTYWICTLNLIHTLEGKWTVITIESNIRVNVFKPVQIITWWTDTKYFMNGNIFILEGITNTQNNGSESMYNFYSNVYPEQIRICYWTIGLIKVNALDPGTPICTVFWNEVTCIRTVTLFDTLINNITEDFCIIRE